MRVINVYSAAAVVVLMAFYGCGSSRSAASNDYAQTTSWQSQPLVVDGSDSDWVKPLPFQDNKQKLSYKVSNDSNNLYIVMSTADEQMQQKIMQGGLTVWINTGAQKTEEGAAGINFPTGASSRRGKAILPIAGPASKNKVMALDQLKDYSLFGFDDNGVENVDYGKPNNKGIELNIGFNHSNELTYEASVPLKSIFPKSSASTYTRKTIAVGFIIDALPPQPGDRDNGGGVSVGGGLGMGSYGSGVGLSIGTGLGRIGGKGSRFKQSKIWQVFTLSRTAQN